MKQVNFDELAHGRKKKEESKSEGVYAKFVNLLGNAAKAGIKICAKRADELSPILRFYPHSEKTEHEQTPVRSGIKKPSLQAGPSPTCRSAETCTCLRTGGRTFKGCFCHLPLNVLFSGDLHAIDKQLFVANEAFALTLSAF